MSISCTLTAIDVPESSLQNNSGVSANEIAEGMEFGKKIFGKSLSTARSSWTEQYPGIEGDMPPQKEKTLQQGTATVLVAALSPDIKGNVESSSITIGQRAKSLHRVFGRKSDRLSDDADREPRNGRREQAETVGFE